MQSANQCNIISLQTALRQIFYRTQLASGNLDQLQSFREQLFILDYPIHKPSDLTGLKGPTVFPSVV